MPPGRCPRHRLGIARKSRIVGNLQGAPRVPAGCTKQRGKKLGIGHTKSSGTRRTPRLVRMVASLAERPGGKVLDVFRSSAEQQAAYDFLGNEKVRSADILDAMQTATVRRCADEPWVHVVVDATRLRLTDRGRTKGCDRRLCAPTAQRGWGLRCAVARFAITPTETIPDDIPSMADAVRWLAELGGHAGRPSSGRPGAVTIRRGLEFIKPVAIAIELLENEGKL
ncbi:MAG: transposase DNA-binding-containing protein [Deltaproteobacteria bacterium]|nr:transposase DNA-binding-containing protein [Deltaproteobacteria bacterium]